MVVAPFGDAQLSDASRDQLVSLVAFDDEFQLVTQTCQSTHVLINIIHAHCEPGSTDEARRAAEAFSASSIASLCCCSSFFHSSRRILVVCVCCRFYAESKQVI